MNAARQADQRYAGARYLMDAIETSSPAQRLVMLYDRLELDLASADAAFERAEIPAINSFLVHAQEIVLALRQTLCVEAWAGGRTLAGLYDLILSELLQANMTKDRARAAGAATLVAQLAQAWRKAASEAPVGVA